VFEIQPLEAGAQAVLCGGGRYDGLIEQLGGKPTPGIGFATGFERIILNLKRQNIQIQAADPALVLLAHLGTNAQRECIKIASLLRKNNVRTVVAPAGRSLKGQMRYGSSSGATFALILGDDELSKGMIVLRNLQLGEQKAIPLNEIVQYLPDILCK
jgi:histidyl-tRNA synthetase